MKKNEYRVPTNSKGLNDIDFKIEFPNKFNQSLQDFLTPSMKVKPLEIHKNSLVIKGFNTEGYKYFTPKYIEFRGKRHVRWRTKIIDTMITPEIAIIYVDNDIRKWSHAGGIVLYFESNLYTILNGPF